MLVTSGRSLTARKGKVKKQEVITVSIRLPFQVSIGYAMVFTLSYKLRRHPYDGVDSVSDQYAHREVSGVLWGSKRRVQGNTTSNGIWRDGYRAKTTPEHVAFLILSTSLTDILHNGLGHIAFIRPQVWGDHSNRAWRRPGSSLQPIASRVAMVYP